MCLAIAKQTERRDGFGDHSELSDQGVQKGCARPAGRAATRSLLSAPYLLTAWSYYILRARGRDRPASRRVLHARRRSGMQVLLGAHRVPPRAALAALAAHAAPAPHAEHAEHAEHARPISARRLHAGAPAASLRITAHHRASCASPRITCASPRITARRRRWRRRRSRRRSRRLPPSRARTRREGAAGSCTRLRNHARCVGAEAHAGGMSGSTAAARRSLCDGDVHGGRAGQDDAVAGLGGHSRRARDGEPTAEEAGRLLGPLPAQPIARAAARPRAALRASARRDWRLAH